MVSTRHVRMTRANDSYPYRDLVLWQKAFALAEVIYRETRHFPDDDRQGLVADLRRSALSISCHVAEHYTFSTTDFLRGLHLARRQLLRLEHQLLIARRLHCWPAGRSAAVSQRLADIHRLFRAFFNTLGLWGREARGEG